jgi:hypothetical protein
VAVLPRIAPPQFVHQLQTGGETSTSATPLQILEVCNTMGGVLTSGPTVSSWAPGRLDVFARGTDNTLHHPFYDGNWSGWESLGGGLSSDPAAVSWDHGRIDVFARGSDNALWHKWYDNGWKP